MNVCVLSNSIDNKEVLNGTWISIGQTNLCIDFPLFVRRVIVDLDTLHLVSTGSVISIFSSFCPLLFTSS